VVRDDVVLGEGWHQRAGEPHAEVNAIAAARKVAGSDSLSDTTIYVSLEPCNHQGKTPPCTHAILDAGIKHVVYATADTTSAASGGSEALKAAGVEVLSGICEEQAQHTNRFFFHYQSQNTPYVLAKFASSLDGRTATRTGHSQWITGDAARQRGHYLRQAVDAILIGANTAVADNPQLTVRNPEAHAHGTVAHPLRIVLDSTGRVPLDNALFNTSLIGKTLLVTTNACTKDHKAALIEQGVDVLTLQSAINSTQIDLNSLLVELGKRQIQSLLVEGGHTVLGAFTDRGLVNEVWAFLAPMLIGGVNAAPSIGGIGTDELNNALSLTDINMEYLNPDVLITGRVQQREERS